MAVRQHEEAPQPIEPDHRAKEISISLPAVGADLIAGDYEKVIASLSNHEDHLSPEFHAPLSWAYVMQGNALFEQAKLKRGEEADRLFALTAEKYQAALRIKPDMPDALYNWGTALLEQAKLKRGEEASRLYSDARAVPELMYGLHLRFPWWAGASRAQMPYADVKTALGKSFSGPNRSRQEAVHITWHV
jgi:tetratricopeptide (TPR) repeat protein